MKLTKIKPKVYFTFLTNAPLQWWETSFVSKIEQSVTNNKNGSFVLTEDPNSADLIILLESNYFKTQKYIGNLLKDPLILNFPNKVFTVNYEYSPIGFLPGLYTSLTKNKHNLMRHKAWGYMHHPNGEKYYNPHKHLEPPEYLFSFRGAISHPVREKLFSTKFSNTLVYKLTQIDKWFNHNHNEVIDYQNEILNSYFVLCPRGLATSTYRLFETMALGRCPVIISDDWLPIEGIDWEKCSIMIKESELEKIPQILELSLGEALEMGQRARAIWETYFSPKNKYSSIVNEILKLKQSRPPEYDEKIYQRYWLTRNFYQQNGWATEQRAIRKIKKVFNLMK